MNRPSVEMNVTYYREYGMHPVKQTNGSVDFITSFPNWEDTAEALEDMPYEGSVITPECATAPSDYKPTSDDPGLIQERIRQAQDMTARTDATLYLGTPYPVIDQDGDRRILNTVLAFHRKELVGMTHKTMLTMGETDLEFQPPKRDTRNAIGGNAVAICAELQLVDYIPRMKLLAPEQIFAPTHWAQPSRVPEEHLRERINKAGGEDNFYRNRLEETIGSYTLSFLPSVSRVIISDRGRTGMTGHADIAPYNAVFDRVA